MLSWVPGGLGNARDWLTNAQHTYYRGTTQKVQTGHAPVVGDVVVFGPGQQGALDHGHVAIVTKVNPNWTFDVTEMHFPGLDKQTNRTNLNPKDVLGFIVSPGNAAQGAMQPGSSTPDASRQSIAESYFKAGWQNDGIAGKEGTYNGPTSATLGGLDLAAVPKILGFISDPKEWWRIGFVVIGGSLIIVGVVGYFIRPNLAAMPKVIPV